MLELLYSKHRILTLALGLIVFVHIGKMVVEAAWWLNLSFFGFILFMATAFGVWVHGAVEWKPPSR